MSKPSRVRVLVVDDDAAVVRYLARSLESFADVSVATTAEKALAKLAEGPRHDIVLLDLHLPSDDALSIYRSLVASRIPVIVMTGGAVNEAEEDLLRELADHVILKPFQKSELVELIGRVLTLRAVA